MMIFGCCSLPYISFVKSNRSRLHEFDLSSRDELLYDPVRCQRDVTLLHLQRGAAVERRRMNGRLGGRGTSMTRTLVVAPADSPGGRVHRPGSSCLAQ